MFSQSGERPDPVEFFAFECLACRVKRKPAQQNLIGLSEGLHPSASIDLQAVEILGFAGALMFFDPDFTDMDPGRTPAGQPQPRAPAAELEPGARTSPLPRVW